MRAWIRIAGVLWLAVLGLGVGVPAAGAYIYWADPQNDTIGRAENDGSHPNDSFIHTGELPISVAVDSSHIYWASGFEHLIGRANIDGSAVEKTFICGLADPSDVKVNAQHIYWSDFVGGIGRANLDGSNPNPKFITGATGLCGLALDGGHIYWTEPLAGEPAFIGRAGIEGAVESLAFVTLTETSTPCALAVTPASIYWAEPGFFGPNGKRIGRANTVDGKGVDKSFIAGASGPCGLALDGSSHLFWANAGTGTIGRANTDGTGVSQSFVNTGGGEVCGVAVDSLASPPEPPPGGGGGNTDAVPPETKVTKGPGRKLAMGKARFSFSSSEAQSTFTCKLDGKKPARCRSPKAYAGLRPGRHTFRVWATDAAGNRDPTAAKRTFRVPGAGAGA